MNRIIPILLFVAYIIMYFFIDKFHMVWLSAIATLICASLIYLFYASTSVTLKGDLVINRQSKKPQPFLIFITSLWTISALFWRPENLPLAILFWGLTSADLVACAIYAYKKPPYIAISSNEILVNSLVPERRNIHTLYAVILNGFTNAITLSFENKNAVVIKRSEFAEEDIKQLLIMLTTIKKGNLHISENLANDKRYFA